MERYSDCMCGVKKVRMLSSMVSQVFLNFNMFKYVYTCMMHIWRDENKTC